jgi:RNA polymerase sigma factor (sigma-70 family)
MDWHKRYKNWGYDLGGLSVHNPQFYRWYYHTSKVDEKPLFGRYAREKVTQVGLEELDRPVDMENELDMFALKDTLRKVLLTLTPREERVIRERFLNGKTLEEVGQTFSLSRDGIFHIQRNALRKLQRPATKELLEDFA